mmetsp:Transcript_28599/g.78498  ORF Transcript_28599/g.78498 Transcript_28599/m.78498 type:complete len:218 (+) Transcript_28599:653-1306(+)
MSESFSKVVSADSRKAASICLLLHGLPSPRHVTVRTRAERLWSTMQPLPCKCRSTAWYSPPAKSANTTLAHSACSERPESWPGLVQTGRSTFAMTRTCEGAEAADTRAKRLARRRAAQSRSRCTSAGLWHVASVRCGMHTPVTAWSRTSKLRGCSCELSKSRTRSLWTSTQEMQARTSAGAPASGVARLPTRPPRQRGARPGSSLVPRMAELLPLPV